MKKRCLDLETLYVESFQTGSAAWDGRGTAREQEELGGVRFDTFRNCPTAYGCPPTPLN